MARLSLPEAIKRIKEPKNAREIREAREKRYRHQLHTESRMNNTVQSHGSELFLSWVKAVLRSDDNYERFKQLYRHPLATGQLTKEIFDEFEKIFDAQNAHETFEFTDPLLENDLQEYRRRIADFQFWPTQGFSTFKNDIDNVMVIDLPRIERDQNGNVVPPATNRPEPYYYVLDINSLQDIENTKVIGVESSSNKSFTYFRTEYVIF